MENQNNGLNVENTEETTVKVNTDIEKALKVLEEHGLEVEIKEKDEESLFVGVKTAVEVLNQSKLRQEIISEKIEEFTAYKVKKMIKNGVLKGFEGASNKEGYQIERKTLDAYIAERKISKEEWRQRALAAEKKLAEYEKNEHKKDDLNDICEGQTSLEDFVKEDDVETVQTAENTSGDASQQVETNIFGDHLKGKEEIIKKENEQDQHEQVETNQVVSTEEQQLIEFFSANKRQRPNAKKVGMMLVDIFSVEEKELKEMSAEMKWKLLKEQCLDEGTDKKYILEQLKSY